MIEFSGRGILLDIEGTTTSIDFVYSVLFPFARREVAHYLKRHWHSAEVLKARELLARDLGCDSREAWEAQLPSDARAEEALVRAVIELMDRDVKATGLKELQGLIWRDGYTSGELRSHVYPDVPPALRQWHDAGVDLRIFSSGSIEAQKLLFGHTESGDLLALFSGYYDTTTGPKRERNSYAAIASDWGLPPADVLFISDVVAELDAARAAGMRTALSLRPGNPPQNNNEAQHPEIKNFGDVTIRR